LSKYRIYAFIVGHSYATASANRQTNITVGGHADRGPVNDNDNDKCMKVTQTTSNNSTAVYLLGQTSSREALSTARNFEWLITILILTL